MCIRDRIYEVVRHSHFFKDLPYFAVVHTVKDFCIVNEADVFLELSGFLHNAAHVSNLKGGMDQEKKESV